MVSISRRTDKMRFRYYSDHNQDDEKKAVKRPRIEIVMRKSQNSANESTNPEFRTFGLVDSGADISFIPRSIAEILCLDLDDTKTKTTKSASEDFETYRTSMYLEIQYQKQRVGVGMIEVAVPKEDPQGKDGEQQVLIGRKGLFDKYKITFDEAGKTISLNRNARS